MIQQTTHYGMGTTVRVPYERAVPIVREALAAEGFGVLAEIDIAATLKQKLGMAFRPYVILGACNPRLAYQALAEERDIGLLLPCNVIVYAADEPGTSVVAVVDPLETFQLAGNESVRPIALEVREKLEHVLELTERRSLLAG
jgi:uncharacterized protein (DUF302 family)